MEEIRYINGIDYDHSNMITKIAYECGSCTKHEKFSIVEFNANTARVKCRGCNAEKTVYCGKF